MAQLEVELDQPLPGRIGVGDGTALFLSGRCSATTGQPVARLSIVANGDEYPVMAHGVQRSASGAADAWWGLVDFAPVSSPRSVGLGLRATLGDGARAQVEVGSVRLEPGRPLATNPEPSGKAGEPEPLIAVCMATFEPPLDLFERQIESIRAQTHANWVCIVSDDHSRPERLAEMRRVIGDDPRFRFSVARERQGFYGNFERALELVPAEATHVALADQDDRWYPDKLESLAAALEPGIRLVYSDMRVTDAEGRIISDTYWRYRRNNHTDFTSLLIANSITGAAALFHRELLTRALPFPPPHGEIYHDAWLALVAMATGEIRYIDRPLYDYVQHYQAAIGFTNANAGKGRAGSWAGDLLIRILRLAWRIVRPVGQIRYFDNYCALALQARVLELRFGAEMTPDKRRAMRRVRSCDGSRAGILWLALRSLRPLFGANQTMGVERGLLAGAIWRWNATRRSRSGGRRASLARLKHAHEGRPRRP